ncbi:MAG: hypothetical protein ACRCVN_03300 [Spirochaetia bacterium]
MLPVPPEHPALEEPERLSERDLAQLAEFYRQYEKFLKKWKVFKET